MGVAAWVIAGTVIEFCNRIALFRGPVGDSIRRAAGLPRSVWGMTIAHASLGIIVAGITASSAWQSERIQLMRAGDAVEVAGYSFTFEGATRLQGPNYTATRGTFVVRRGGETIATLTPERRSYPAEKSGTTEAAIHTTWLSDLYAVIGDADGDGAWSTRIYHNPLVPWIWAGAIFMAIGGLVSLTDRRLRVGAPKRARRQTAASGADPVGA